MPVIMRSLIHTTVEKYCELGYKKAQSIILAAHELGLSVSDVSRGIYYSEAPLVETNGIAVDPIWYDRVMEIATHAGELQVRLRYCDKLVKMLDREDLPIDHRRIESIKFLLVQLGQEVKNCIPHSVCPQCAEKYDNNCTLCGGYGWIPNPD